MPESVNSIRRHLAAFAISIACVGACTGCDPVDYLYDHISITGEKTGCGSYTVAKESEDGRWILEVSDQVEFTGDTLYTQDLADPASAKVVMRKFSQAHILHQKYCTDVSAGVTVLKSHQATQGTLRVKIYDTMLDTLVGADSVLHVSRRFRIDLDMQGVKFGAEAKIDKHSIDSVWAGWLPG